MLTATASRHLSTFVHLRNKQIVQTDGTRSLSTFSTAIYLQASNPQAAVNSGAYDGCLHNEMMSILDRDKTSSQSIAWSTTLFMAAFHIGAIAALFCAWRYLLASGRRDHDPDG
jgi:hypothetical protein